MAATATAAASARVGNHNDFLRNLFTCQHEISDAKNDDRRRPPCCPAIHAFALSTPGIALRRPPPRALILAIDSPPPPPPSPPVFSGRDGGDGENENSINPSLSSLPHCRKFDACHSSYPPLCLRCIDPSAVRYALR